MTGIVWLLYLADLSSSLSTVGVLLGIGAFMSAVLATIFAKTSFPEVEPPAWRKSAVIFGAVCWTVAAILPSKTTIYAIAATELGEKALQSETGDKAIRALNAWLDRQIAGDKSQ